MTEENKLQYLNALAQYRLNRRISEEIDQFMKGVVLRVAYKYKVHV